MQKKLLLRRTIFINYTNNHPCGYLRKTEEIEAWFCFYDNFYIDAAVCQVSLVVTRILGLWRERLLFNR
jgi:hypothetical protein